MGEPSEMVAASRMQNMVHIRKKKHLFRDQHVFVVFTFRALGVESPPSPRGAMFASLVLGLDSYSFLLFWAPF